MKLSYILESRENLLDKVYIFQQEDWLDPEINIEDAHKHFTMGYTQDTAPGITPVAALVSDVRRLKPNSDDVRYKVKMKLEDFIRNCVEFGNDPYHILSVVKQAGGPDAAKAAYEFMKNPDNNLKVAMIGSDGNGTIRTDSYNAKLDL